MNEAIKAVLKWGPMHNGWTWGEVLIITAFVGLAMFFVWLSDDDGCNP